MIDKILDIGIPCFNDDKYLRRCVQSIADCFKGDYDKIQIWIIDDDSMYSEGYLKIIEDFNFLNFTYIKNEVNSGPGQSRNKIFELGQAEWITFIDDDDIFCSNIISLIKDSNEEVIISEVYTNHGVLWYKIYDLIRGINGIILKRDFITKYNIKFNSILRYNSEDILMVLIIKSLSLNILYTKQNFIMRIDRESDEDITNFTYKGKFGNPLEERMKKLESLNFIFLFNEYLQYIQNYHFLINLAKRYFDDWENIFQDFHKFNLKHLILWFYFCCYIITEENLFYNKNNNFSNSFLAYYNWIKDNIQIENDMISVPICNFSFNIIEYLNSYFNTNYLYYVKNNREYRNLPEKYLKFNKVNIQQTN